MYISDDVATSSSIDDSGNRPLYEGAKITLAVSMVLIISFAMRHALTGEALADLLLLIEVHCLTPNLCKNSLKAFRNYFKSLNTPLQFHYFCEHCHMYHGLARVEICPTCQTASKKTTSAYFLVIPIVSQLMSLFGGKYFFENGYDR